MSKKFKTKIEITSPAANKHEAMEIVDDFLSGNIMSGVDMKCSTRQVHFYDHAAAKIAAILLVCTAFLFSFKSSPQSNLNIGTCQMAAVQPPLKTSGAVLNELKFREEWEQKQLREALDFIKK